jgi:hypothetical protein
MGVSAHLVMALVFKAIVADSRFSSYCRKFFGNMQVTKEIDLSILSAISPKKGVYRRQRGNERGKVAT